MADIAFSYLRYSSPAQARGDSARRQLSASVDWAERHGLELDTSLRDLGVSGFTGLNRVKGALGSFLRRVDSGEIPSGSYLLVDSMDRLSRENEGEVLHLLTGLTRRGIKIVNVAEGHVLDDKAEAIDYIRVIIEASRSHRESVEKGRKVAIAHAQSKKLAREQGRIWHSAGPTWLKREGEKWSVIPEKVRVLRRAFDLREAGMGTTAIAIRFNEDGEQTPRGEQHPSGRGTWHHSTVLEMLKNRAVLGEYQPKLARGGNRASRRPHDGDPIPNYYPAVISADQFHRVQGLIAATHPKAGRRANTVQVSNLFAGVVVCRHCAGSFGLTASGQKYSKPVLRCYGAARGLCQNRRRYRYDKVEAAILAHVRDFDLTPGAPEDDAAQLALNAALGRLAELEAQLDVLLNRIEAGGADELVERRYAQRREQWAAAKAEVAELQRAANVEKVRPAPELRMRQIAELQADMAGKEGRDLYDTRIRLSAAIRDVVTSVEFGNDGEFTVKVLDGFSTYTFRDFELAMALPGAPHLVTQAKYAKRFLKGDPAREAKARRVLRNLGRTG